MPEVHRNAAGWFERHGLADDAIGHALAAGDGEWAARIVERKIDAFLLRREEATLERWLGALPPELVASRPRLLLAQADLALSRGNVDAVERALSGAEHHLSKDADAVYEPSVGKQASLVANVPAAIAFWRAYLAEFRGDADAAVDFDRRALAELGDGLSVLASATRLHLYGAELLRGEVAAAEPCFASSMAEFGASGDVYLALRACELLGHVQRARGRLDAARQTYERGLSIAAAPGRSPSAAAGVAFVGLAEVAYQQGALDAALEYREAAPTVGAMVSGAGWAQPHPSAVADRGVAHLLDPVPALQARLQQECCWRNSAGVPWPAGSCVGSGRRARRVVCEAARSEGFRPCRGAERARAPGAAAAGVGQGEPGDRRGTGGRAGHGQEACLTSWPSWARRAARRRSPARASSVCA